MATTPRIAATANRVRVVCAATKNTHENKNIKTDEIK